MTKREDKLVLQAESRWGRTRRASCPPHSPILIDAFEGGYHVASCLACGLSGPERKNGWEAKAAFDESVR